MPPKAPKAVPPSKGGGKKAPAALVAKLKARMEQQKEEEERFRREKEEEERRIREEDRLAREQEKFEEEQSKLEKERLKEEEKQKKKLGKNSQNDALERMRAFGFIVPDVEKIRAETKDAPPAVYQRQKRAKAGAAAAAALASSQATQARRKTEDQEEGEETEEEEDDDEETEPSESDQEVDEDNWEEMCEQETRREARKEKNEEIRQRREEKKKAKEAARQKKKEEKMANVTKELRSPICCVLGHVDSGKTSLLDRIRSSNVQKGEAGGITQQIGATFFPAEGLLAATGELREGLDMRVPGLLVIDTPGHESFTNLRSRGSSICDIAVLVVDITRGLELQTKESIRLLREQRCPFIVALNKVDRLYDWVSHENMAFEKTFGTQKKHVQQEFHNRWAQVQKELMEEGLNSELYYQNTELRKVVSVVPTSAHTGEGVCDLLMLEIKLVQEFMKDKVTLRDDLECTVLELKRITGLGATMDCILINGELHENDEICLCGQTGPIFTRIRSILTPQPMKEMRVKGAYEHHRTIKAAMGIKICANEIENVVPGTSLVVVHDESEREDAEKAVMSDATRLQELVDKNGMGVSVQSSTLGALEALLTYLKEMKIPVGAAAIGPIQKRHLYPSVSMKRKDPHLAVMLAFDVEVSDGAKEMAEKEDIQIFCANVIYHLFDRFTRYIKEYDESELERLRDEVIFPVQLAITGDAFHAADPLVIPVSVVRGQLREGTPLCLVKDDEAVNVGRVMSMEFDGKTVKKGTPGMEFAVKINTSTSRVVFGRQIDRTTTLFSRITRPSVNAIKKFRDEINADDVNLLATLIKMLKVPN